MRLKGLRNSVGSSSGYRTSGREVTIEADSLVTMWPSSEPREPNVRPRIVREFTDALARRVEENVRARGERPQVSDQIPMGVM